MKNRFYQFTKSQQQAFQLQLGGISLLILCISAGLLYWIDVHLLPLAAFEFAILITIIAPFYDTPTLVQQQKLHYHSPFFITETEKDGVLKMHGGTLFDYYFTLPKNSKEQDHTRLILCEYLKGLLHCIEQHSPEVILEGTSYIINERTAVKIGFKKVQTNSLQHFILTFNYFNLMTSLYLAKGKLEFPKLSNTHTFRAPIKNLKENKATIVGLIARLESDS
ncbi:MAG: hypothetical protein CL843_15110 [Crocinitomicaceae bacterium]|nr:hypothetical protein [Crocinitomicaceae bacterium]|tara:strand:- start:6484 stop:7149 length:666 start_codon:yes stop_codon:yes gene_type:complete